MEEKKDGWARFNALLDVAEEERKKYEESKKSREKEGNLRRNISIISEFLLKTEKENSQTKDSRRAAQHFEQSVNQKGKRLDRNKISSTDTLNKLSQLPNLDDNHQEKDCRNPNPFGDVIKKSSERLSDTIGEEIPRPKKAKNVDVEEPINAIPEAFYFEGNQEVKDGNIMYSHGSIKKSPSKRLRDKGEGKAKMPRPRKTKKVDLEGPVQPLPENFKSKIRALGGSESEITFVFQKALSASDVDSHQSRLLIPFNQVKDHSFLTDEERKLLIQIEEKNKRLKIPAILIDPNCDEGQMNLTRWDMVKDLSNVTGNYSLLTHWRKTVEKNGLREGNVVQLWGFRKGPELGLAIVKV